MRSLLVLLVLLLFPSLSSAEAIYVAQSAAGADNGTNCANAHSATWFNTAANWGGGAGEIDPGDTAHLCGTITTPLAMQASGSAGNPITVLWETGAKISHATCSPSCVNMNSKSYITLDGGTNGIIEATNNGTLLGNKITTNKAIDCTNCPNAEIKNLTIRNLYVVSMVDLTGGGYGIYLYNSANSNVSIHHNTFTESFYGINWNLAGSETNNTIYSNTFTKQGWPIVYGSGNGGVSASGITIHDNDIYMDCKWCGGQPNHYHLDPIHIWAVQAGVAITGIQVYNNYIHGDMGSGNTTSGIFIESFTGNNVESKVYNNLIVATAGFFTDGAINPASKGGAITTVLVNNTIDCGPRAGLGVEIFGNGANHTLTFKNNILTNCGHTVYVDTPTPNPISTANYNSYYNWTNGFHYGTNFYGTLAAWRTVCSCDANAVASNPNLDASYHPKSGSPVIQAGTNLTSLGITALNSDKAGAARPASGPWDAGVYVFSTAPAPPTGLRVQ